VMKKAILGIVIENSESVMANVKRMDLYRSNGWKGMPNVRKIAWYGMFMSESRCVSETNPDREVLTLAGFVV
jgi:hypothetical protein